MNIIITFCLFLILGLLFNFVLFKKDKNELKNDSFISSERLIIFIIEIIVAVIGFGVTLYITNANERQVEKENALNIIEQTIEYTDKQITMDDSYIKSYYNGEYTNIRYVRSSVISIDYYKNILSNDVIVQNTNMNTYGEIMRYLIWLEDYDTRAKIAMKNSTKEEYYKEEDLSDSSSVYFNMYHRREQLKKIRELLEVCRKELSGEIMAEEAEKLCYDIKYETSTNTESTTNADK